MLDRRTFVLTGSAAALLLTRIDRLAAADGDAVAPQSAEFKAAYDALVGEWVKTYDHLFKVPILNAPTFDGRRDVSPSFQQAIDVLIDELAGEFGVSCRCLDAAHREGWVDAVLRGSGLPLQAPQIELKI